MLTITPPSEKYSAVKNPINWKACTDVTVFTPGSKASIILQIGGATPAANNFFILQLAGINFEYTFRTTPDSPFDLQAGVVPTGTQLAAKFLEQRFISENYDVTEASGEITITAKENGRDDSVNNFVTSWDSIINEHGTDVGENDTDRAYKTLADIYIADEKLATISGVPSEGCNTFNLEEYLRTVVSHPEPETGGDIRLAENVIKPYTLHFWEQYDSATVGKTTDADHIAWNGGSLNEYQDTFQPTVLYFETDPNSQDPAERKFLTNRPRTSKIQMLELQWLYWYTPLVAVTMHYKITYSNGATQTLTKAKTLAEAEQVYAFRCDLQYWQVNVLDQVVENIVKAEFWVSTADEESERRYFVREAEGNPFTRHFAFGNSLGGLDFVTTKNYVQKGTEVDGYTTLSSDHLNRKTVKNYTDIYQVSTGCIDQATANWLQELFISDAVYLHDGASWIPVVVENSKVNLWKDKRGYYEIAFSYRMAYDSKAVDHHQRIL